MAIQVQIGLQKLIEDLARMEKVALDSECQSMTDKYKDQFRMKALAYSDAMNAARNLYDACFPAKPEPPVIAAPTRNEKDTSNWRHSLKSWDEVIVCVSGGGSEDWFTIAVAADLGTAVAVGGFVVPKSSGTNVLGVNGHTVTVEIFPPDCTRALGKLARSEFDSLVKTWSKGPEHRNLSMTQIKAILDVLKPKA